MAEESSENFVFGEVGVEQGGIQPQVSQRQQHATPDELTGIAKEIWNQVCLSKVDPHDDAGNDALLARLQKEFKEFSISFPLVLRWMVQLRKFKSRVFKAYLLKHAASALTTREAYLELQAEYLVLMYRAETNHPTEKAVQQYRKMVIDSLMKEDKDFMALNDQVEKEMADQMVSNDQDRRQRLYAQLLSLKVQQGS